MNRDIAQARKLYIDSNIIIYYVEGTEESQRQADALFEYAETNDILLMTSEMAVGECLYGAYKRDRADSVEKFEAIFDEVGIFHMIPVEVEIMKRAAKIGAQHKLKLIDAQHVASAIDVGCDAFITSDRGISSTPDLKVVQLPDLESAELDIHAN